jgi:hypothetical protein
MAKKCSVCGGDANGCRPMGGRLIHEPLTAEDWKELYLFYIHVHLPFVHALCERARERYMNDTEEVTMP